MNHERAILADEPKEERWAEKDCSNCTRGESMPRSNYYECSAVDPDSLPKPSDPKNCPYYERRIEEAGHA